MALESGSLGLQILELFGLRTLPPYNVDSVCSIFTFWDWTSFSACWSIFRAPCSSCSACWTSCSACCKASFEFKIASISARRARTLSRWLSICCSRYSLNGALIGRNYRFGEGERQEELT